MKKDTKKKLHALDPRFRKRFTELMSMMDESISLLYEAATHDEKTGLYNNKFFENMLEMEIEKAKRGQEKLSLFIIDIDFDGFVSAIEILNASENLNLDKDLLTSIGKASMSIIYKPNYLYIFLILCVLDKEKEIAIPLTIDLGHKQIEKQEVVFAK